MSAATLGSADVAIVGGGLMGSAAAYYLAKGGVDVAVLERGSINREASGSNAGSLHLQIYIHPHFPEDWIERIRPSIALMREAAKGWAMMESELGTDCGVRLGGGLWVAETPDEMRLIEKKVTAERAMGVESTVLLRNELLAVAPYLGPHVIGGSFLKGEGFANPLLVTPAHTKAAARHGAKFFSDAPVRSITRQRDGGFVVETGRGALRARQVVSAAGAWTAELGRMVGLKIPVTGAAGQVIVTEGRPPIMLDHLLQHVGKGLTLKQSRQGTFIIGGGWPGHYDPVCGRCVPLLEFDRWQLLGGNEDSSRDRACAAGPRLVGHGLGRTRRLAHHRQVERGEGFSRSLRAARLHYGPDLRKGFCREFPYRRRDGAGRTLHARPISVS